MFIFDRPLSAVLAAFAVAAAVVVASELYRQHMDVVAEAAETSSLRLTAGELANSKP